VGVFKKVVEARHRYAGFIKDLLLKLGAVTQGCSNNMLNKLKPGTVTRGVQTMFKNCLKLGAFTRGVFKPNF